jgi:hypothetical protein
MSTTHASLLVSAKVLDEDVVLLQATVTLREATDPLAW